MAGAPMSRESDSEKLFELLSFHLKNHASLAIQDIYKCLYQGVYGAEHLLKHPQKAHDYLLEEWETYL